MLVLVDVLLPFQSKTYLLALRHMRKILFLMRDFRMGGGERMTLSLVTHLDRHIFQPCIIAVAEKGPLRDAVPPDVKVSSLNGSQGGALVFPWRILVYSFRLRKIIQRERPSLVVTDNWFVGIIGCLVAGTIRNCGAKLIVEFHLPVRESLGTSSFQNILAPVKKLVTTMLFKRADCIVAVSQHIRNQLSSRLGINVNKIVTIYNGIDNDEIRRKAFIGVDRVIFQNPYIVSVGRLSNEKGHEILIRAFRLIADQIEHQLVIVGDGEKKQSLEMLVTELGLKERVVMTGVIPQPYLQMIRADFLVLPSLWEAFSFVLLEALSLEVPVIATECDGPIEILQNGEYGMLVPPSNVEALAGTMLRFAKDSVLRSSFRDSSLARAREFSFKHMLERYEALFINL